MLTLFKIWKMFSFGNICLAAALVAGASGYTYNYKEKEFFGQTMTEEDGIYAWNRLYNYGSAGLAETEIAGDSWGIDQSCLGGLTCYHQNYTNESAMADEYDCQGLYACANNEMYLMEYALCEAHLGCPATTWYLASLWQWGEQDCFGVGSCAYQTSIALDSGYFYYYPDAMMAAYYADWQTSGISTSYWWWNEMWAYGFASTYGAKLTCRGNDTCWLECDGAHACYGLTYICEEEATCYLYGCNTTNHVHCPLLEGDGSFIYEKNTYPWNYINITQQDTPELLVDYTDLDYYVPLGYWIRQWAKKFVGTKEDIESINAETYYYDNCYINLGDYYHGQYEVWNGLNDINETYYTGNTESNNICFSGYRGGDYLTIIFDENDNDYNLVFDAESSGYGMTVYNLGENSVITCSGHQSCDYITIWGGYEMNCLGEDTGNYATAYNLTILRALSWWSAYQGNFYNVKEVFGGAGNGLYYTKMYSPGEDGNPQELNVYLSGSWVGYGDSVYCRGEDSCTVWYYGNPDDMYVNRYCDVDTTCDTKYNDYSWIDVDTNAPTSLPTSLPPTKAPSEEPTRAPTGIPTSSPTEANTTITFLLVLEGTFDYGDDATTTAEKIEVADEVIVEAVEYILDDNEVIYGDVSSDTQTAGQYVIESYVTVTDTELSAEELVDLVETNINIAINNLENGDDGDEDDDSNFVITSAASSVVSVSGSGSSNSGSSSTSTSSGSSLSEDYTIFIYILIVFGALFLLMATWFVVDWYFNKKKKSARNRRFLEAGEEDGERGRAASLQSESGTNVAGDFGGGSDGGIAGGATGVTGVTGVTGATTNMNTDDVLFSSVNLSNQQQTYQTNMQMAAMQQQMAAMQQQMAMMAQMNQMNQMGVQMGAMGPMGPMGVQMMNLPAQPQSNIVTPYGGGRDGDPNVTGDSGSVVMAAPVNGFGGAAAAAAAGDALPAQPQVSTPMGPAETNGGAQGGEGEGNAGGDNIDNIDNIDDNNYMDNGGGNNDLLSFDSPTQQ